MRITQYIYKRLQEDYPELFIPSEKSEKVSALFAPFLPITALTDSSQDPWCELGSRDVPVKRKTILLSFKDLENFPFKELIEIDRLACFLKRAGFKVLLPADDKLEEYDLQLFDREKIKNVLGKSRAELSKIAMDQERIIADNIFFMDEIKKESYLSNDFLAIEEEEKSNFSGYEKKEKNIDGEFSVTLFDKGQAEIEDEHENENEKISLRDFLLKNKNVGILKINFDALEECQDQLFPVFENLYDLSIFSSFEFKETAIVQKSLMCLEKLHCENYKTLKNLCEINAFSELRELSVHKKSLSRMQSALKINAPKLTFLHLGIKAFGETIDLCSLKSLNRLEIEYHALSVKESETHLTFITDVNNNLIEISVTGKITTLDKLIPVIENSPNLRVLELDDIFIPEKKIQELQEKFPNLLMTIKWSKKFPGPKKQIEIEKAKSVDRQHNLQQNNPLQLRQSEVFEKSNLPKSKEIPGPGGDENFVYQTTCAIELDFDTRHDPNVTYTMRPVCKHLSHNFSNRFHYTRDSVYRLTEDLEVEEIKPSVMTSYELPLNIKKEKLDLYEVNDDINIKTNGKIKLKSLSTYDRLIELRVNGKLLKSDEIKITRDNFGFYEVTFLREMTGQLTYQHDVSHAPLPRLARLPEKLQIYIDNIKSFPSSGVESLSGFFLITRKRKLMAMYHQRKASCRHRVPILLYFLGELKKEFPKEYEKIQMRGAIRGGVHQNVEISTDGGIMWHEEDLGGFEAKTECTSTILPSISFSAKTAVPIYTFPEMLKRINNEPGKNILFCLKETGDIARCLLQIKKFCSSRPVFYVDSPGDLKTFQEGPRLNEQRSECDITLTGNLMDFLIEYKNQNPIIVINWENFTPLEIVRVNSIITGEKRKIGILDIPTNVSIVGLHSKNEKLSDLLYDTSFLSRHVSGGVHDFTDKTIPAILVPAAARSAEKILRINLHFSPRWHDILTGSAIVDKDRLCWQEGELLAALNDPEINIIELLNPPASCVEFENFVSDLRAGEPLYFLNQKIKIKQTLDVKIFHNEFKIKRNYFKIAKIKFPPENTLIINSSTFEQCLYLKKIDDNGLLSSEEGLIASSLTDSLSLCISSTLSVSQWSLLIACAEKYKIKLDVFILPDVSLPDFLKNFTFNGPVLPSYACVNRFIISNNLSYSLSVLSFELSNPKIIDISEITIDDLFCKISFKRSEKTFSFTKKFSSVWNALINGETIILKGRISNDMLNYLATFFSPTPYFMLEGFRYEFPGRLIVVSDDTFSPPSWLSVERKNEPLSEKKIIPPFVASLIDPNDLSIEACELFEKNRLNSVLHIAQYSPFVLLEGPPASGKSYFFYDLEKLRGIKTYNEKNVKGFLTDDFDGDKFLLRDEINLHQTDCTSDSDLLNKSPSLFVDGEYIKVVGKCTILYTQNRLESSGARTEQRLFKEHPEAKILFEKMHPAFILHRILRPIFKTTYSEDESFLLAKKILYDSARSLRDLQTQALFICALKKFPLPDNPLECTSEVCVGINGFTLTASRFPQYRQLLTLLAARRFKQALSIDAPDSARFGGVNGFIFVGPPGLGKSEFITRTLESEGCKEYYCFATEVDEDEMLVILDRAFHEGAILIVDEIDSCPLEKYFNSCLAGFDRFGNKAEKAGFTMLCSANGAHNKGRGLLTEPFLSRFLVMPFNEYSRDELIQILQAKFVMPGSGVKYLQESGITKKLINYIVDEFLAQQNKQKFETPPTFRDLEEFCKKYFENIFPKLKSKLSFEQHQVVLAYRNHPGMQILINRLQSSEINAEKTSVAELVGMLKQNVVASSLFSPDDNVSQDAPHFIGPTHSA